MASDPTEIRERSWVEYRQPTTAPVEEEMWVAEDPETQCLGVGTVEDEAVGNLVAVVVEWEGDADATEPLMKAPGRVVPRPSMQDGVTNTVFDSLRSLL